MPAFGTSLTHARLRELAVEAECDPRTVARVLRGEKGGSLRVQRACERVLREANLLPGESTESTETNTTQATEVDGAP
jgi:hypothetical protein